MSTSCESTLRWMPQNTCDENWILVQVMAWCRQATSHYLNQCWPWSLSPNNVSRPKWVKPFLLNCSETHTQKKLAFSIISQPSDGTGQLNHPSDGTGQLNHPSDGTGQLNRPSWKTRTCLSYVVNTTSCWCPGNVRNQGISSNGINTLKLRQNRRHFSDDIFKCILLVCISIKISQKFVPNGPCNNIPSFVQITWSQSAIIWTNDGLGYWRIYVTWPQWVNDNDSLIDPLSRFFFFPCCKVW